MPVLDENSYSRDATIAAFRDYYHFLTELYMDESDIIEPPPDGWPSITPEFQQLFSKSDEVIDLLRHLPYIREDCPEGELHPPQGSLVCYWADWQHLAAVSFTADGEPTSIGLGLVICSEGARDNIPAHVVGLTSGDRENPVFLLHTKAGLVYWPEWDGGRDKQLHDSAREAGIEESWDESDEETSDNEEDTPEDDDDLPKNNLNMHENEGPLREEPSWAVEDFFALLKLQYRKLHWIPTNARQVIGSYSLESSQNGLGAKLQEIYRKHGWSEDEGAQYRKRDCLQTVAVELKDNWPTFQGLV